MKERIIGIDVARALAIFGMIIVNFKIAFGSHGGKVLKSLLSIFDGKAASTFVVLAGIGIGFMTRKALSQNDSKLIKSIRTKIFKRSIFLLTIGLLYMPIWPADILHYYGVYMMLVLLCLRLPRKWLLIIATFFILIYPLLMMIWNYEAGWDFSTLTYSGFWTVSGFFRNLFYNGFHPVIPWSAFMLVGYWFSKFDLNDNTFLKKAIKISSALFIFTLLVSKSLIYFLSIDDYSIRSELVQILGTSPMPPLPIYMISGSCVAILIISSLILISKKYSTNKIILALKSTGQLAFTFYVAHVIIGMVIVDIIAPNSLGTYSTMFSFAYACLFFLMCVVFAMIWTKNHKMGPLEWVMRKVAG